jgi:hypothetical protein
MIRGRRLGGPVTERSGTQGSNLAVPLYQSGPFNQLGRARERKMRVSSSTSHKPATGFQGPLPRRRRTFHRGTRRFRPPLPIGSQPLSRRCPPLDGISFQIGSPARCERTGDGRGRRNRISRRYRRHPGSGRGQPPGWFILHAKRAGDSNTTGLPAQSLAATPDS